MRGLRTAIALVAALVIGAVAALAALGCSAAGHQAALVKYRRSGGLAGGYTQLIVEKGEKARLTTGSGTRRGLLGPKTRARLRRALRRAHFARLSPSYEPAAPVPDAFTHKITHAGHTVRAVDTAVPSRLQAVIDILNRIAAKLGS